MRITYHTRRRDMVVGGMMSLFYNRVIRILSLLGIGWVVYSFSREAVRKEERFVSSIFVLIVRCS